MHDAEVLAHTQPSDSQPVKKLPSTYAGVDKYHSGGLIANAGAAVPLAPAFYQCTCQVRLPRMRHASRVFFEHDGDMLGVDGAYVVVLKPAHQVGGSCLQHGIASTPST